MMKRSEEERKNWPEGIHKKFNDMQNRKVWRIITKDEVAKGRRLIGSKWVFKRKKVEGIDLDWLH